ncbi:pseudouridine synthase [Halteromyces radiatus]|uniref:pseudouridine synthase n=1 Tax=Halteromyces radiatus TaxID=101107 RepID=UPI0022204350|nr:pseudouridine synthase [Halteromyces radiatus]KAI8077722.1 pseudouridine synthase [Halteromyces radiatus]
MSSWSRLFSWFKKLSPTSTDIYNTWTRQQLIDRLRVLESTTVNKNNRVKKPFNMNKYPQHRVALKVAYLGWNYLGFASQKETDQTVEGQLFKALEYCKLIQDPTSCDFTRCGRTDKGVSGLGQVVALNVRQSSGKDRPIPYVETLNALLPQDIRVLAWSPVSPGFNARFDCISRTYRYMFLKQDLDVDAMQKAANYMIGSHDFRNFCKLDPSKQQSYNRHILSIDIVPCQQHYQVVIKGTAFLWHQVRCIMSVLFLVGQRLERPEIVLDLLDIDKVNAKPDYPLASDLPLLLYDCEFEKGQLDWQYGLRPQRLQQHWNELWYDQTVRSWLYQTFLEDLSEKPSVYTPKPTSTIVLGAGKVIRTTKYRPLLERARADSEQIKREKYQAKLQRKQSPID